MMLIRNIGHGDIFVGFPVNLESRYSDHEYPYGVKEWLAENSIPIRPGILTGKKVGIFLNGEDAIAFKLRFGL